MPERPLLVFPQPAVIGRRKKFGGGGEVTMPLPRHQAQRLVSRISEIDRYFSQRRVELRSGPAGAEPEDVLVLETIGAVEDFLRAVNRIPGMEWLGDVDIGDIPADEDFYIDEERHKRLTGRLYLIMSNQQGMQELLRLFYIFRTNPDHPQFGWGQGRWRYIFSQLKDIRPWGPEDRMMETGLLEDWQTRVRYGEEIVPLEVELWFRTDAVRRAEAFEKVSQRILELQGEVVNQAIIEEIRYHAFIGRIPIANLGDLSNLRETRLVRSSEIMLLRPVGQASVLLPEEDSVAGFSEPTSALPTGIQPIVALLDGLPLENHVRLDGRLIVDDVDNWAADTEAIERVHGTAMASLIIHGDLDDDEAALARPLYVRPIIRPNPDDWRGPRTESIPEHVLPADLIHQAVRRLYESNAGEEAATSTIRIINLSVCDRNHQFYQYPSPWARMLDYSSWHYNVLFIVSAGNHPNAIDLDTQVTDWPALLSDPEKLQEQILRAVNNDARNRRLLVPAEAINALTIGALHGDSSTPSLPTNIVDPFPNNACVSPISAQGVGFRRSIKPDVLMPGGRQVYRDNLTGSNGNVALNASEYASAPGQRVASPNLQPGIINATIYTRGTSNAAALATRLAAQLYDQVMDIRPEPNGNLLTDEYMTVIIKALTVHGSSWSVVGQTIQNLLHTNDKDTLMRLLGYGVVDRTRVYECTEERATIVGCGKLYDNEAHRYNIPLPPSLSGEMIRRRLTVTLAWMSPINPSHQGYRAAEMWFEPYGNDRSDGDASDILRISRREAQWQAARRGTVQHEIFEGEQVSSFGPDDFIKIQVNCCADAGNLHESVRYALVVSLEVAPGQGIPVYNEIRMRIQQPVPIAVGTDIVNQ